MDFEKFLEKVFSSDENKQIEILSEYANYPFTKYQLFNIFNIIEKRNYYQFYKLFKSLIEKYQNQEYYYLLISMKNDKQDAETFFKNIDNYLQFFQKLDKSSEYTTYFYQQLLKLCHQNQQYLNDIQEQKILKLVKENIKEKKNITFDELVFIGKKTLKQENLLKLANKITNETLKNAYGYTRFKLYLLFKEECQIKIDYNYLQKQFKENTEELLFQTLYTLFHEIEHVKQVKFCLSKENYQRQTTKKIAISYKRGFFIEQLLGHDNEKNYNNMLIEYNAKLLGMLKTLSFIEQEFKELFSPDFIKNKYKEVNEIIKENTSIYEKFNNIFLANQEEYETSQYKKDFENTLIQRNYNQKLTSYETEFLNEEFLKLLLGQDNVYLNIINRKNIFFNQIIELLLDTINKKGKRK